MSVLLSPLSLQAADIRRSGEDTFIIQQQRQEALEQQLTPSAPDVRLSAPGSFAHKINFPVETPCFQIKQTELKGADALPHWLPLQKIANGAVGHCLGAKGINLLMSTLQNRLVDHGYVTTRVLAPSQDLKSGILRLVVIPGVVRHVRLTPDSDDYIQLYSSFPAHEGSLLDLRDIEQGLENMQRLPGVQADMEIVPGEQPGESDILITRKYALDEQRGKYMTVSELKTEVFGIMQAFNRHIPAEEQLRRYDEARNQNGSEQQQKQAEMALNQLINRYQVEHAGKPERQP
ncbi:TPA: hypothetical protein OZQ97_004669 [Escherichia coli]|nr:hypothetical protein [Escherichia coli]